MISRLKMVSNNTNGYKKSVHETFPLTSGISLAERCHACLRFRKSMSGHYVSWKQLLDKIQVSLPNSDEDKKKV